ncbi:MAG: hypothetical protein AAGF31_09855 [Planctomycetota bacterium]
MNEDLRAAVLTYTSSPTYKPVKPRIIGERLGLDADGIGELKKVVKKMVRAGELEYGPNHLVLPTNLNHPARAGLTIPTSGVAKAKGKDAGGTGKRGGGDDRSLTGTIRRVASGDAYMRPEGTPASAGKDNDIYLSKRNAGDAASGDVVRVVLSSRSGPRGKIEGKLVDIVERATNRFVGVYYEEAGQGLVQVDGKVFTSPDRKSLRSKPSKLVLRAASMDMLT